MGHDGVAGAGGRWPVIDERHDPAVVRQISDASCVSACGEMLLTDRGVDAVGQAALLAHLGSPAVTLELAGALNRLTGMGLWRSAQLNVSAMGERTAIEILSLSGSWVAELREVQAKIGHAVVVDGLTDDDTLRLRDPFDSTSYRMRIEDFLTYWTWTAVWQERPYEET